MNTSDGFLRADLWRQFVSHPPTRRFGRKHNTAGPCLGDVRPVVNHAVNHDTSFFFFYVRPVRVSSCSVSTVPKSNIFEAVIRCRDGVGRPGRRRLVEARLLPLERVHLWR